MGMGWPQGHAHKSLSPYLLIFCGQTQPIHVLNLDF